MESKFETLLNRFEDLVHRFENASGQVSSGSGASQGASKTQVPVPAASKLIKAFDSDVLPKTNAFEEAAKALDNPTITQIV